jgi:hypothetical protein
LGHISSEEGIVVDPKKIRAIEGWPVTNNVLEVRSFMEFAGYYRRFIEGFSKIAYPITSLQKKGVIFEWNIDCERRFQHLKYLLTSAPILKIPDLDKELVVCTDACKGLGGVLSKNGHVIC